MTSRELQEFGGCDGSDVTRCLVDFRPAGCTACRPFRDLATKQGAHFNVNEVKLCASEATAAGPLPHGGCGQ